MIQRFTQRFRPIALLPTPDTARAENGQGLVEYALITGLISVFVLVVTNVGGLGAAIINAYSAIPAAF